MVQQASGEYCEAVSDEHGIPLANDVADNRVVDVDATSGEPEGAASGTGADLGAIEADLAAVETALARLDSGTYWTDEVTGERIPDQVLEENPLLRRVSR